MDELITEIEETVIALMKYDMEKYSKLAQDVVNKMMAVFPVIINCYGDPRMSDLKEDATYWPGQLERVINALGTGDYFEVVDVLYSETRSNLVELKEVLDRKGLL